MNRLQTDRTQNTSAVADASRVSRGHAGMLVLPAAFHSPANRPIIRLSKLQPTGSQTLVLRVLRADEASQRESGRKVQSIHCEEALDPGFTAGVEGDPIETVAYAAPVSAKDPVQPEGRPGRGLRIRQRSSCGDVGEM